MGTPHTARETTPSKRPLICCLFSSLARKNHPDGLTTAEAEKAWRLAAGDKGERLRYRLVGGC